LQAVALGSAQSSKSFGSRRLNSTAAFGRTDCPLGFPLGRSENGTPLIHEYHSKVLGRLAKLLNLYGQAQAARLGLNIVELVDAHQNGEIVPTIASIPTIQGRGFRSPWRNLSVKSTLCRPPRQSKQAGAVPMLEIHQKGHNRLPERQHRRQAILPGLIYSIPWYSVRYPPELPLLCSTIHPSRRGGDDRRR